MALVVNEIFFSIQGESLKSGCPCVFIRLTGCNLRCSYCDTTYAYHEGTSRSIEALLANVEGYGCPLVAVTGGEPLLQRETPALIRRLLEMGLDVMLETNGTIDISSVDTRCTKIVDVKCPSSGESTKNLPENMRLLTPSDQVKFVIGNRNDFEFAKLFLKRLPIDFPKGHILFSPVKGKLAYDMLAEWILEDRLTVRFHSQLHKTIWPDADRGK